MAARVTRPSRCRRRHEPTGSARKEPMASRGTLRILGVDPSLACTGYGVIDVAGTHVAVCEAGVIRTSSELPLARRIEQIYRCGAELFDRFHPDVMAIEQVHSAYRHPRTAILMAHARGAMLLCAAQHDVPVEGYSPTRVKKSLAGAGRATKRQIQRVVQQELGLAHVPEPDDVADALAVALCHRYAQATSRLLKG